MEKLLEINQLANGSIRNVARLLELSHDKDEEVRFRALEAFENFSPTDEIVTRVREGLNDGDEIVRTTCIELLGDWDDAQSTENLYLALTDKSEIVRSAAITSLGQIARKDTIWVLKEKFTQWQGLEKASAAMALYSMGEADYLGELLCSLDDEDYRVRVAVSNLISSFDVAESDKAKVILKLKQALLREKTRAVSTSVTETIETLQS